MPYRLFANRCVALCLAAAPLVAAAATCATRPVTLVVPYGAGGAADALARPLAAQLSAAWQVPVLVANRAGANGIVATASVVRAAGDGQTLLLQLTSLVQNASLHGRLPYDPFRDLAPVLRIGVQPMALAVGATRPDGDVHGLLARLAADPARGSYGSFGVGSTAHIYGEALRRVASSTLVHVPHRGEAPMLPELVSGRLDLAFVSAAAAVQGQRAGSLRALGVTGTRRLRALPDVPTLAESGLAGFDLVGWYGLFVPAQTPRALQACIASSVQDVLARPAMAQRLAELAIEPSVLTDVQFAGALRDDFLRWDALIKGLGIAAETPAP